jgi:prepilin-type N-terminal cleavage/methylation domain-containing protein
MSLFKSKNVKGFTLIELMIVVAIIGILAAVAIPKFAELVTKSKESATKGTLGAVRSAVSIYYGDNEGVYPSNLFTGLTNANKYLPPLAGTNSLGKYELPAAGASVGHTGGAYSNCVVAGVVTSNATTPPADDTTPLLYSASGASAGVLVVNCSHSDTKSLRWSSY